MSQSLESESLSRAAVAIRYDSVLLHVEPGLASSRRVEIAAGLARRFGGRVIGLGAEALEPPTAVDPYSGQLVAELVVQMTRQIDADLKNAEQAFARDAAGVQSEWRVTQATPNRALAAEARAADLIVMGAQAERSSNVYRSADPAEVVMTAGRPVLVAPAGAAHLKAEKVIVAWKDTRESRRAVADALPFLLRADEVIVQAVCAEDAAEACEAQTQDVAEALRRRGVPARANVTAAPDASVADELLAEAAARGADLIVMGAYGHSRMAEWVFGGVTRTVLADPQVYLLLSH